MKHKLSVGVFLLLVIVATIIVLKGTAMGELGQAPIPAQNASFLHVDSTFKIIGSGTITIPGVNSSSGAGTFHTEAVATSVRHNLGYIPIVLAFMDNTSLGGGYFPLPLTTSSGSGSGSEWREVRIIATTTEVTVYENVTTYNFTHVAFERTIKYFLLENPIR